MANDVRFITPTTALRSIIEHAGETGHAYYLESAVAVSICQELIRLREEQQRYRKISVFMESAYVFMAGIGSRGIEIISSPGYWRIGDKRFIELEDAIAFAVPDISDREWEHHVEKTKS